MAKLNNFDALFFRNEYRELAGTNHKVTLLLTVLLLLTFCALGFALGGYEQLQKRMDNPFTRWVDLRLGGFDQDQRPELEKFLSETLDSSKHNLQDVIEWERYFINVHAREHDPLRDAPGKHAKPYAGRTIEPYDALFNEILKEDNVHYINHDYLFDDESRYNCGVIVKAEMMESLGYTKEEFSSVKHLSLAVGGAEQQTFVQLYGVVEEIPSRCAFLSFPHLYNIVQGENPRLLLSNSNTLGWYFLLSKNPDKAGEIKDNLAAHFQLPRSGFNVQERKIPVDAEEQYSYYAISPSDSVSKAATLEWLALMVQSGNYANYAFLECSGEAKKMGVVDHRSLDFSSLNGLLAFQKDLDEKVGITIPMEDVQNRENFRLVAKLTAILSTTLFLFGLLSIVLYLVNLLNNHVDKIRPHLGTFKAMGLPNEKLLKVYTKIALRLLLTATTLSLPLAWVVGKLANDYLLEVGFKLWHIAIPLAIILILLVASLLVRLRLRSVFATTPGDLIYERD